MRKVEGFPKLPLPSQGSTCLHGEREVQLRWWKRRGCLGFELQVPAAVEPSQILVLLNSGPPLPEFPDGQEVVAEGWSVIRPLPWHMRRALPQRARWFQRADRNDLFALAVAWTCQWAYPTLRCSTEHERLCQRASRKLQSRAARSARTIGRYFFDLVGHAVDSCDPQARRVALRFTPDLRFRVYRQLVDDDSGRLRQLAWTCPGALIFALALVGSLGCAQQAIGETLLRRVKAGVRLPRALAEAVAGWAVTAPGDPALVAHDLSWQRLAQAGPAERERICQQQRLLIRRAGPLVSPELLWRPPPPGLVPEDIPREDRANERWFCAVKEVEWGAGELAAAASSPSLEALAKCVSRHVEALRRCTTSRLAREEAIDQLRCYVLGTGRRPGRHGDPAALLAAARRWNLRQLLPELDPVEAATLALPVLPGSDWHEVDLEVRPLRTALELIDEGRRLKHCVALRLEEAQAGRAFFFSATLEGQPLTLQLGFREGQLVLVEARGEGNRTLRACERRRLNPWLQRCGAR